MNNFNKFAFDLSNARSIAKLEVNGVPYTVKIDNLTHTREYNGVEDSITFAGEVVNTAYDQCGRTIPKETLNALYGNRPIYPINPTYGITRNPDLRTLIDKVIFNNPATIIIWKDGAKTVVKCQEGETFDEEKGLAMAISKRALGDKGNFNEVFKEYVKNEPEKKEEPAKTVYEMVQDTEKIVRKNAFENVADALYSTLTKPYLSIDKMATDMAQLEQVSGMSIETLTKMFASGMVLCEKDYIDRLVSMTNPKEMKK